MVLFYLGITASNILHQTPPKAVRSPAKQDSFKKKLRRRRGENAADKCEICGENYPNNLEAAHIIDRALHETLEAAYAHNNGLPISVNNAENGLLLCPTCHAYFDKKERNIMITPNGTIQLSRDCKDINYKNLNGTKVFWSGLIGVNKDYPTPAVLRYFAELKTKPVENKRLRELEEEKDEENSPVGAKKRKQRK